LQRKRVGGLDDDAGESLDGLGRESLLGPGDSQPGDDVAGVVADRCRHAGRADRLLRIAYRVAAPSNRADVSPQPLSVAQRVRRELRKRRATDVVVDSGIGKERENHLHRRAGVQRDAAAERGVKPDAMARLGLGDEHALVAVAH
jgi:hypothetical protein